MYNKHVDPTLAAEPDAIELADRCRARLAVVELIEELAMQRTGRPRPAGRPARGLDAALGA